jgi:hypothetical protein
MVSLTQNRNKGFGGFAHVASLTLLGVQRQPHSGAAALQAMCLFLLIDQEMLQRVEHKGAKPAARWVGQPETVLLQKVCKKLLGEILGILRTVTTAPDVNEKGIPVGAA